MSAKISKTTRARKSGATKSKVNALPAMNKNHDIRFAATYLAAALLFAYLSSALPSITSAAPGASLRLAAVEAQSCSVQNLKLSQVCPVTYTHSTITCQDGKDAIAMAGLSATGCYTAPELRTAGVKSCAKRCNGKTRICGVKVSRAGAKCEPRYRHAEWDCSDGSRKIQDTTCQTPMQIRANATRVCGALDCTPPATLSPVTISKNSAFADKNANNPTGTTNALQAKVGSFVITAGVGEYVNVSQITLRDDNTNTCAGTYLQNLMLKDGSGKQLALIVPNPSPTCATQNSFTFNISPAVPLVGGGQLIIDVFADLKAPLATAVSLLDVNKVTAAGKTTGTDASADNQNLSLQTVYIASAGSLTVLVEPDSPMATNYLMGAADQAIAKFRVMAQGAEGAVIHSLTVNFVTSPHALNSMQNIRLIDNDTGGAVGAAASALKSVTGVNIGVDASYGQATFSSLNIPVANNGWKVFTVKTDFTAYEAGGWSATGLTATPVLLAATSGTGIDPVVAVGASSGAALPVIISMDHNYSLFGSAPGAYAATGTLYRVKLTTVWSPDTPTGASSPSAAQIVGKFVITNLANAGNYVATVQLINMNLISTIAPSASSTRALSLYKDSLSTTALASTNFALGQRFDGTTKISDANFTNVDIAAGAWKTFWVTLDTTNAASQTALSLRVPGNGVTWSDIITTNIAAMGADLPLQYKTLVY